MEPSPDLDLPDASIRWFPTFLDVVTADRLLTALLELSWRQEHIQLFGRTIAQPRLIAWHGDEGCDYTYSGLTLTPRPWTAPLAELRDRVNDATGFDHNCVLLNLYRDGKDSMGMHADDEPELGPDPHIASVSLGSERMFRLQHRTRGDLRRDLALTHGSLLVMSGPTQRYWKHGVPKTSRSVGRRVNATFRRIG